MAINQPRIKGKRIPRGSAFIAQLDAAVVREAKKFNVSKSFVIATAVAETLGINIIRYYDYEIYAVNNNGKKTRS